MFSPSHSLDHRCFSHVSLFEEQTFLTIFVQKIFTCLLIWSIDVPHLPPYLDNRCSSPVTLFGQQMFFTFLILWTIEVPHMFHYLKNRRSSHYLYKRSLLSPYLVNRSSSPAPLSGKYIFLTCNLIWATDVLSLSQSLDCWCFSHVSLFEEQMFLTLLVQKIFACLFIWSIDVPHLLPYLDNGCSSPVTLFWQQMFFTFLILWTIDVSHMSHYFTCLII
jgi:hypothetical protein